MRQEDIKTRKQLAAYIHSHVSSGAWGVKVPANFQIPAYWADEPVDAHEVDEEIRIWQTICRPWRQADGIGTTTIPW